MRLPNFVIAGAARCVTTALYYYLKQHPDIGFPNKKEPKYFSSFGQVFPHQGPGDRTVDQSIVRDAESYKRLFDGLDQFQWIGEASSDYLYHHQFSAKAMYDALGDIPIILCLRNPTDRAYSAYSNLVRDQREKLPFEAALDEEERRLAENWDWMWAYKAGGLYANQVAAFLEIFSQVKVVLFEDLKTDADKVVKDILQFLQVDDAVEVNTKTRYSHSGKAKNKLVEFLSNRDNPLAFGLRKIALYTVPRSYLEKAASKSLKKDDMNEDTPQMLQDFFKEDIDKLEALIGISLDAWR